jgi:hypothetical protein
MFCWFTDSLDTGLKDQMHPSILKIANIMRNHYQSKIKKMYNKQFRPTPKCFLGPGKKGYNRRVMWDQSLMRKYEVVSKKKHDMHFPPDMSTTNLKQQCHGD